MDKRELLLLVDQCATKQVTKELLTQLINKGDIKLKPSDFVMRMKDEREELLDRITKLGNVINSPERIKDLGLSDEDVTEMSVQYYAMQIYEKALTSRFNRVIDKSNTNKDEFATIDALFKDMATRYQFGLGTDWDEKSWTIYNQAELRLKRENVFVEIMSFANKYNLQGVINFEPQDTICFKYVGDKDGR